MSPAETKIAKLLAEAAGLPAERLAPNSDLFRDLGMDSLNFVEALVAVEVEFSIEIPDLEAEDIETVQGFFDVVRRHAPGEFLPGEAD